MDINIMTVNPDFDLPMPMNPNLRAVCGKQLLRNVHGQALLAGKAHRTHMNAATTVYQQLARNC
jgi:hypothetical protein